MTKLFRNTICLLFVLLAASGFAQDAPAESVQMADGFYAEGKIYVVIGVISIIFLGIAVYLFTIERKLKKLEEAIKEKN